MNDLLDRPVKSALAEIVAHAPAAGPAPTAPIVALQPAEHRRVWVLVAAAAVAVLGTVGIVAAVARRGPTARSASPSAGSEAPPTSDAALQPVATLPDGADVAAAPVTAAADSPPAWYRLQPDLDVSWQSRADGTTELCWRTPAGDDCRPDGDVTPLALPTAGGQTLVVVRGGDTSQHDVDLGLSDGTIVRAPVDWDVQISWGVARVELADGITVAAIGTSRNISAVDDAVTGATLPPALDLSDGPTPTVPAGSELSYWRFLPDLDVAERATADGTGTDLCWRTPAGTGCVDDAFQSPDVGIIPTDGAVIFLARPAVVPIVPPPSDPMAPRMQAGPEPTTVDVTFSDGTTASVALRDDDVFGVGHARVDVPAGLTVTAATSR